MADEWEMPTFAFHDLDYIPSGYSGILAPYIETGPGTMRAAVTLMGLDSALSTQRVVCDLGCGDGEFIIGLLKHVNHTIIHPNSSLAVHGIGIDYNAELIKTATVNALEAGEEVAWFTYDFNEDGADICTKLRGLGVTHIFVYLVPKQLMLKSVRGILERLKKSGVVLCFHKFQPTYLTALRSNALMDLVVY